MIARNPLLWTLSLCILLASLSSGHPASRYILQQKATLDRLRRQTGAKPENNKPLDLELGKPPPPGMDGQPKLNGPDIVGQGGDAPADMESQVQITDKQPTGQNTTETGMPPKYPLNVESAEAQAHESEVAGCRDHPNAAAICSKARNPCFSEEHETYMYSFCRKSSKYCDAETRTFHRYWRLRAGSTFNPSWMVGEIQFFRERGTNVTLNTNSSQAYASSEYTGYHAARAYDDDVTSMWMPDGWNTHSGNDDWIGYQFEIPVKINSIRLRGNPQYPRSAPSKIFVEGADEMFGPFKTKWLIRNSDYSTEKIFNFIECPVLWRKYESGDTPICFRLIAKYKTWMDAREECHMEGGELASVNNAEESKFIKEEVKPCGFTWLGLNDRKLEGNYEWADKSNATYTGWKVDQIYDEVQRHYEDCVAVDKDGNWYSFSCQNKFYFLCRRPLVEPAPPAPEKPPAKEEPPIQFMAPNFTVPVVGNMPSTEASEEENEKEHYSELLTDVALEEMKEKGLKPPDSISNIVVPPPNLAEQLSNLTKTALKNMGQEDEGKTNADIGKELQGNNSEVSTSNDTTKTPGVIVPAGTGQPTNLTQQPKELPRPSSPGQTPIGEVPGMKPEGNLSLPDGDGTKPNLSLPDGTPPKPPPPKETGGPNENQSPSVGEAGDEGPQGQEGEQGRPKGKRKGLKSPTKKKPIHQSPESVSNAPAYPDELKSPADDSKLDHRVGPHHNKKPVSLQGPSIANSGESISKEQVVRNNQVQVNVAGFYNTKNSNQVSSKKETTGSHNHRFEVSTIHSGKPVKSAVTKGEEFQENEALELDNSNSDSGSGSGSGSEGDELDIDEDLIDLAIDDVV